MSGDKLRLPIGRHEQILSDGRISFASEAEMRDALAALAWLHGWDVATEVATTTGGRADLVLSQNGVVLPIELKLSIKTKREARIGFQQADGYHRHFKIDARRCFGVLAANAVDFSICAEANDLYPDIYLMRVGYLMGVIRGTHWWGFTEHHDRRWTVLDRKRQIRKLSELIDKEEMRHAGDRRDEFLVDLAKQYPAMAGMLLEAIA